ncbi:GNAT family N-acetyltransferase [Caulobacter sp. DWR1-3-2b1]|uniref:GNAT family N-acetyltransferase n=1 Tax=Caulobacter sp. DWR1-3-2b1 TaxID=2804670 RepID=UPI003CE7BD3C
MFEYQPTLNGGLISLRPARLDDWEGLFEVGRDPDVWASLPHLQLHLEEKFRAYFLDGLASGGALVAATRDSERIIGWSRYSSQFVGRREMEVGWTFLGCAYWGGRYNGEMKHLMLAHAFLFVERVIFRIRETNLRSRRAAEKIGAKQLPDRKVQGSDNAPPILFYAINRGELAADHLLMA